jgi:hypothetical protein
MVVCRLRSVPPTASNRFLLRFPVYKSVVQSGKGGVFVALDLRQPRLTDVILKVGLRNGQMSSCAVGWLRAYKTRPSRLL